MQPSSNDGLRCEPGQARVDQIPGRESATSCVQHDRSGPRVETMTDFLTWSPISLGRWFGTTVRVHFTLVLFVVFQLVTTAVSLAYKRNLASSRR